MATHVPSSAAGALSRYDAMAARPAIAQPRNGNAKVVAEEFEAVFLNAMFKEMFETIKGDGPLGGAGAGGVWRSFLAEEYAKSFAKAGGVGIGAQVFHTLIGAQEAANK